MGAEVLLTVISSYLQMCTCADVTTRLPHSTVAWVSMALMDGKAEIAEAGG